MKYTAVLLMFSVNLFCFQNKLTISCWEFPKEDIIKKKMKMGIIYHNYINPIFYNEDYKYIAFIGILISYNEWIEIQFSPINFFTIPINKNFASNTYFNLAFTIYIAKYSIIADTITIKFFIGTQVDLTLRTTIFTGKTTNAFLYPSLPLITLKFEIDFIPNNYSIYSKLSTSFKEFILLDLGISIFMT
ncbi:hypothetical protein [Borreliella japonica]|uniref:Outer membrane protein n=1 Tax=Borreliella japonica TaxID=34095 RepID=A0A1G4PYU8_BORJA|nr:hypothetical protein [Borreliella japonica]WKC87712.1 hypothetical protein QIA21_00630 [Borreliella japonica]WKC88642.1 hypothetical protein QIA20_00640 [Borreliella japonica]SCW37355.1 hypothetical protein SAMN02983004_00847 [Borreliella japonica]